MFFFSRDFLYQNFNRNTSASDEVVVVDIDDQSLNILSPSYGRWPWPRRVYKDLLEFVSMGAPRKILFDITFGESQTEGTAPSVDDRELAAISESLGLVSHAMELLPDARFEDGHKDPFPEKLALKHGVEVLFQPREDEEIFKKHNVTYEDHLLPLSKFIDQLPLIHIVSTRPDVDGVFRRLPLFTVYKGVSLPSLTLQAIMDSDSKAIKLSEHVLKVGTMSAPLDTHMKLSLHFYKDELRPKSIPIAPILDSAKKLQEGSVTDPKELTVQPEEFKNKIVIIGASAVGLEDLKSTPVHPTYPGVLLHATAISNILTADYLKEEPYVLFVITLMLLAGLSYFCIFYFPNMLIKLLPPLLVLLVYNGAAFYMFQHHSYAMNFLMTNVIAFLAFLDAFIYVSFVEGKDKKRFQETLSKYLSPAVTAELIRSGQDPRAEIGKRTELSILFSDIRGFTKLSEKHEPEFVVGLLNEYLGSMTDLVFETKGTLDKFIGDAVMAFWGAPVKNEVHAVSAVKCALQMTSELSLLNLKWEKQGRAMKFQIGIGINSGDVIVGNIGSEKRLDYTVIGDNVNLSSRLEGLTKYYGAAIIIGPRTYELLEAGAHPKIHCRFVDKVAVVGKELPVLIYEPLGESEEHAAAAQSFNAAWKLYEARDFVGAETLFLSVQPQDKLCALFAERCRKFQKNMPPPGWDAVYHAESK